MIHPFSFFSVPASGSAVEGAGSVEIEFNLSANSSLGLAGVPAPVNPEFTLLATPSQGISSSALVEGVFAISASVVTSEVVTFNQSLSAKEALPSLLEDSLTLSDSISPSELLRLSGSFNLESEASYISSETLLAETSLSLKEGLVFWSDYVPEHCPVEESLPLTLGTLDLGIPEDGDTFEADIPQVFSYQNEALSVAVTRGYDVDNLSSQQEQALHDLYALAEPFTVKVFNLSFDAVFESAPRTTLTHYSPDTGCKLFSANLTLRILP